MEALIVDDHRLFAEAIRPSLEDRGMHVTVVTTGREALETAGTSTIGLALVDLGLPDMRGIDVGTRILEMQPSTTVLALTAIDDDRHVAPVLQAGFRGYLTKNLRIPGLLSAIDAAVSGQVVTPGLTSSFGTAARSRSERHVELLASTLTPREREVLALLADGASGSDIALEMSISVNTVRTHVQSILTKLQVHSRLEAATFAIRHDLVPGSREGADGEGRSSRRAV
jgi:two-component system, NarL family, nitrate/nitrite response regulator NarL